MGCHSTIPDQIREKSSAGGYILSAFVPGVELGSIPTVAGG